MTRTVPHHRDPPSMDHAAPDQRTEPVLSWALAALVRRIPALRAVL